MLRARQSRLSPATIGNCPGTAAVRIMVTVPFRLLVDNVTTVELVAP